MPVPGVDPWYWDRLRGWAENPNQLGFFALVIVLLGLHLAESAQRVSGSALALALIVPAFVAGLMSHSDSFVIGLMMSGALFIALKASIWVQIKEMAPTLRGAAVVLGVMSLPLAIAAAIPFTSSAVSRIEQSSEAMYGDNDQGETRLHLWSEALNKGLESRLIGFGPGPHLTSKSYKRPPPNKFEAHNTPLDLFAQGGIVAVATFVWLIGSALIGSTRARIPALAGLVAGLLVFSMFHYTVRHPIFWFGVVLCLLETAQVSRSRRVGDPIPVPASVSG